MGRQSGQNSSFANICSISNICILYEIYAFDIKYMCSISNICVLNLNYKTTLHVFTKNVYPKLNKNILRTLLILFVMNIGVTIYPRRRVTPSRDTNWNVAFITSRIWCYITFLISQKKTRLICTWIRHFQLFMCCLWSLYLLWFSDRAKHIDVSNMKCSTNRFNFSSLPSM